MVACLLGLLLTITGAGWAEDPPTPAFDVAPWPIDLTIVQPEYPDLAKRAVISGEVTTRLTIGADGRVDKVDAKAVPQGIGFEDRVDNAVRQWRFLPAQCAGKLCPSVIDLAFEFVLCQNAADSVRWTQQTATASEGNLQRATDPRSIYHPAPVIYYWKPARTEGDPGFNAGREGSVKRIGIRTPLPIKAKH